ncbi:MAG: hypothetical protein H6559_34885 [Lewinellaceae bacterium]|nr:hypothetical protein [Lewinellaceae bacterium]
MATNEKWPELHDKASRGEELTEEEKQLLGDWYAQQDRMEPEAILQAGQESLLAGLQAQIEAALAQLAKITSRIQEVAAENDKLQNENAALLRQLPQRAGQQPG